MLATIVETRELLLTVAAAFIAGVGVTAAFAVVIFAAARMADFHRAERPLAATAAGILMAVAGIVSLASLVFGIVVMTQKS